VCWEEGILRFFDPVEERYLRSHEEDVSRAATAEVQAEEERTSRMAAEARAQEETAARETVEARVVELEEELRRLRGD